MSDNRTTELKSLSKLKKAGKLRYWRGTIEIPENELHAICDEIQAEHEQAVAATLGRPKAKAHPYGYEPDTGAFDCTRCECGCINDISATYCNDCGGEIEIDMDAEKEIYHTPRHMVFAEKHDDGSLEFCERRYVPEDTATLGKPMTDANLEQALSFMRIWISEDAHLGESELSAAFEKAEGLRKLDAIESAIAATLGEQPRDKTEEWLLKACNQVTQDYVKALEELVRDMWHTLSAMYQLNLGIDIGKEHDYEQRIAALGIEVIDE